MFSHLLYGIINWGNASNVYIDIAQNQLNRIIQVLCKSCTFRVKLSQAYKHFKIQKIFNLHTNEVSKFLFLFKNNKLPKCLQNYFVSASQIYNHNNKYSKNDSLYALRVKKTKTKRLIRVCGVKIGTISQ